MKVAFFLSSLAGGGVERSTLYLAGALVRAGHAVELVVCKPKGELRDQIPSGVGLVELPREGVLLARLRPLRSDPAGAAALLLPVLLPFSASNKLRFLSGLAEYLRRTRPDVLISAMTWPNLVALWARRAAGVRTRVVVSERNSFSSYVAHFSQRWRWRFLPGLVGRVYPWADAIVSVADAVGDDLAETTGLARARIRTLYNPVIGADLEARAAADPGHPWLGDPALPVVLAAGRLRANKDFATLLRAFARARRVRPLRLVILGDGEQREALHALAQELGVAEHVALPGWVENPLAWMSRASLFVLSSAWEGLPGVLIQALACGCPVVSTDAPGGASEILAGGALGPLVRVGDDEALAAAMLSVLEKPPDAATARAAADRFRVENSVRAWSSLLEELE